MLDFKIPIIFAPTATGKTELIIKLSRELNVEICSMDSMQIYKKMDIGTAKPTPEELNRYPHHLIDIVFPDEAYDASKYRQNAFQQIDAILSRGNLPLFVGGTGLYMDVLRYGLFDGVTRDETLRDELTQKEQESPGILMEMLKRVDEESASRIHENDLKRKIRALEVYFRTGQKFSELGRKRIPDERFALIYLSRERKEIYERINSRVDKMISAGLVEETEGLMREYSPNLQSMKAIGYRETIDYLRGIFPSQEAYVDTLKKNTRHYAKRQIIWARRYGEMETVCVDSNVPSDICRQLKAIILRKNVKQ